MDRYRTSSLFKYNIRDYLERLFINSGGMYVNIASGYYDVYGNRADVLTRSNARTYESPVDRWIYESDCSGVSPYTTTICSGCYINDTWYAKGSGVYAPVIDYNNGRVLLSSDVPVGATVSTEYSYKQVVVDFPDSHAVNLLFSQVKDNADLTATSAPSGNFRQVPIVIVDLFNTRKHPHALGGYKRVEQTVVFHILTNNDDELDIITDLLVDQYGKTFMGVDYNDAPTQFTYQGDKSSTYQSYTTLQGNTAYQWNRIYVDEVRKRPSDYFGDYRRGRVDWELTIFTN